MSHISVQDLRFGFRKEPLLTDINFRCESGGFTTFLGASGCGKSTLLRLIAGLLNPTAGELVVGSHAADDPPRIGFVFQKPTLCPWRNAISNIQLPLQLKGSSRRDRIARARQARALVELSFQDEQKLPASLSGGMQMRVSLARALVTQPQVMLMDEPFSALDEVLRQQLSETCLAVWKKSRWTTIFVTHNVTEAAFMSQTIHILAGSPATIVDSLTVPFVERNAALRTSVDFLRFVSELGQRLRLAVESSGDKAS